MFFLIVIWTCFSHIIHSQKKTWLNHTSNNLGLDPLKTSWEKNKSESLKVLFDLIDGHC